MESTFAARWMRKFRILTLSLIFSGALNIAFLALFFSRTIQERRQAFSYRIPMESLRHAEQTLKNCDLLESYSLLSFRELASLLTNLEFVEEGYRKRDLALSSLVTKHHFHLEKALGGPPLQKREVETPSQGSFKLFPGLTDEQFEAVIRFAYLEKWPLQAEGLFQCMKRSPQPMDQSLKEAFVFTQEFDALFRLFQKNESTDRKEDLIDLVCDGSWDLLSGFVREQSQMLDLSDERRRRLLLSYLALHSPAAARLLLQTDFDFALKKLNDQGVSDLLTCVKGCDALLRSFCVALLESPRSDGVWQQSAQLLSCLEGIEGERTITRKDALDRFSGSSESFSKQVSSADQAIRHIVQEGESLWKIARLYKVKVDDLISQNNIEQDSILRPGAVLEIP